MNQYNATLEIAGVALRLGVAGLSSRHCEFLKAKYRLFEIAAPVAQPISVHVACGGSGLPSPNYGNPIAQTDAAHLIRFRHRSLDATFDPVAMRVEAHAVASGPHPVENLLRFVVSDRLIRNKGMLAHSAGILTDAGALICFGKSEAGKTTISRKAGATAVFSDEMPAILCSGGAYEVYATPFFGEMGRGELCSHARLRYACVLVGKDRRDAHVLKKSEALQHLLGVAFCYSVDKDIEAFTVQWCQNIVDDMPVIALCSERDEPIKSIIERVEQALARA